MIVAIHQPIFLPWMGYFDKMDKSDLFILLDEVQLTDSEMIQRNRVLNSKGEPAYITIAFEKKNYMQKQLRDVRLNKNVDWQKRAKDFLKGTYGKMKYYDEVMSFLSPIFEKEYDNLFEVNRESLFLIKDMLEIGTEIKFQSEIDYDRDKKKSDLVLEICKALNVNTYLSGSGAKKYMDLNSFSENNINVEFQTFQQPKYIQNLSKEAFVPGLSIVDMMLNCGIEETVKTFTERNK